MSKSTNIKRFFPNLYKPFLNTYIKGLLEAIGEQDDNAATEIQNAKEQIFVATAIGQYLDILGSNVGVERPVDSTGFFYLEDAYYRLVVPLLSYYPKQVRNTMEALLVAFFGINADIFVKEINPNEIVIQLPANVSTIKNDLEGTTHFRQHSGNVIEIDNVLKTIRVNFDNSLNEKIALFQKTGQFTVYNAATANLELGNGRISDDNGGIEFDKAGAVSATCGVNIDHQYYPLDLSSDKQISCAIYLSSVTNVVSVSVELFTGAGNSSTWTNTLAAADLVDGWNFVNFDITQVATSTTGAGVTDTSVSAVSPLVTFSAVGDALTDIQITDIHSVSQTDLFSANEHLGKDFANDGNQFDIVSHNAGSADVVLQFDLADDLSVFSKLDKFHIINSNWQGDFVFYPTGPAFSIRSNRATLNQIITATDPGGVIDFVDSTDIPDAAGYLVFNYGASNEEALVPYLERPDGVSLIITPAYAFTEDHVVGEVVNTITFGALEPNDDGSDNAIYVSGASSLVEILTALLEMVRATGVIIRFVVKV